MKKDHFWFAGWLMIALAIPSVAAESRNLTVDAEKPISATNFATVQAAIDAVPAGNTQPTDITIAPGRYSEHVSIPRGKNAVTLRGAGADRTKVWIGHGAATHDEHATLSVEADDLGIENLTVENTAGATAGPQMAIYTSGKRQIFENVLVKGWQDTLGVWDGAQAYFHNCDVWGSVDFIYSGGTALFDHSDITEIRDTGGDLTAPSTPATIPYGLVFLHCHCKAAPGVQPGSTGLMRPWRPDGMSAFIDCTLDADISARGWDPWDGREKTCRAIEYGSQASDGKPIDLTARAPWGHRLTATGARQFTPVTIFQGWDPTSKASAQKRSARLTK